MAELSLGICNIKLIKDPCHEDQQHKNLVIFIFIFLVLSNESCPVFISTAEQQYHHRQTHKDNKLTIDMQTIKCYYYLIILVNNLQAYPYLFFFYCKTKADTIGLLTTCFPPISIQFKNPKFPRKFPVVPPPLPFTLTSTLT